MDGKEGENHPKLMVQWWLSRGTDFGGRVAIEIMGHSRFNAAKDNIPLSKLFRADKMSVALYPMWLYLLLANLSGEIKEYMNISFEKEGKYVEMKGESTTQLQWLVEVRGHMALMGVRGENYEPVAEQMNKNL